MRVDASRLGLVIGKGGSEKPLVQLPKGKGIKLSILQERDAREAKASHK